jgi:TPR repeat protein
MRARDQRTGREVALKLVMGALDRTRRERFQREAEVTGALSHPGIVRVHTAGIGPGERPYIAYELVDGAGLDRVLEDAPRGRRLELVRDVARALGHAHARGIVHRDVKPENVLVDREGRVRVADFGLAAASDLERLTRSGTIVGTPSYMAPEQITGERGAVGPWSDVWSLGVLLYLALTDALPFAAENLVTLSMQIATKDPEAPRSVDPTIPRDVEAVCLKALSRAPATRYQDGEALAADLDRALRGEHVSAVRPPALAGMARPLLWATPIALSFAGLVVAYALASGPPAPDLPAAPVAVAAPPPPPTALVAAPAPVDPEPARPRGWSFQDPPPPVVGSADLEALARLAETEAMPMRLMGNAYLKGEGLEIDPRAAASWYFRAIQAGDVDAMVRLARLLEGGYPQVAADPANVVRFYEQAAATGSDEAMQRLGDYYLDRAPRRDDALAVRWLRRAAAMGNEHAQVRLGRVLMEGRGDLQGDEADRAAHDLLRQGVAQENSKGMYLLGRLLLEGRGCARDVVEGAALIKRAAEAGDVEAAAFTRRVERSRPGDE